MDRFEGISRRRILTFSLSSLGLFLLSPATSILAQTQCEPTGADILGPFYRPEAPFRSVLGDGTLRIFGMVRSTNCAPIPGALLEIWQADPDGEYDFFGEDYNYYARLIGGRDGRYQFHTDLPGLYEARPIRHIHYRVTAKGYNALVTQQYFKDETEKTESEFDFVLVPKE